MKSLLLEGALGIRIRSLSTRDCASGKTREANAVTHYELHIFAQPGVETIGLRAGLRADDPGGAFRIRNHEPRSAAL